MPAPDQSVVERQYYLSVLGWAVDVPSLSLEDLRQRVLEAKTIKALDKNIRYEDPTQPLPSTLQASGFGATSATDNGDGGVTLATTPTAFKFPKYSYAEATYFKIANAIQLATNPPQPSSTTPSAGVLQRAAREDHSHLISPQVPPIANTFSAGNNGWLTRPNGTGTSGTNNRAHFSLVYLSSFNRAPILASALGVYVQTAAGAGGQVRCGLWRPAANGGLDLSVGNKVWEGGAVSTTTTGFKMSAFGPGSISEGIYWWGVAMQTANATLWQTDSGIYVQHPFNNQDKTNLFYVDGVTGAFPTTGGAPGGDLAPCMYYTAA